AWVHVGHDEGDDIDLILHHDAKGHQSVDSLGYRVTHRGYLIYWVIISLGLILGIMDLFQVDLNALFIPNLGLILGVVGTLFSVIMMLLGNKFFANDTHEESEMKLASLKETIIHNAQETAFVGTWVF